MNKFKLTRITQFACVVFCTFLFSQVFSQIPQGMNYQAIARNNDGSILTDQTVNIRLSITDGNTGPMVYQETQDAMTNSFGLFTLTIGSGSSTLGSFSTIDWGAITPWLQVEMDYLGGNNFKLMGTSQLQSVPYALFAAKSGGESAWDANGSNIFFNNLVGIGTDDPVSPLSIETVINEVGFTHSTSENDIVLGTAISDVAGTIGTTSNHPLSLLSGGNGLLHLLPDGRVVLGEDEDPSNITGTNQVRSTPLISKLYLETPINSSGWIHVAGPDSIIVSEGVGGVSAAIGTVTNHIFRLNAGGQGKLHIWPDGNVMVGSNADAPIGKFTVHTPNNSIGITHISDGGIILNTTVGGISAAIGTNSNHAMRIVANSMAVINIEPDGNVGIGTTNPAGYRLAVNGKIRAKEIVVESGWADHVFHQDYKLTPLTEVEAYIQQHQHLPNIPSSEEIETSGLHVGDVQMKMMEKIEELTLHIIALNKRIESLENQSGHQQTNNQ